MKLIYLLTAPLVVARVVTLQQQTAIHEEEIERIRANPIVHDEAAPAVGIHFTTSYAVAAARYQNGTMRDLGKVLGDAEYIDLMSRWTEWDRDSRKKRQECHHYQSYRYTSATEAMPRSFQRNALLLQRSARKVLGLAASSEAATLSAFMKKARGAIELELDAPVTSIAPAFPRLPPYVEDDVQEAMSLSGLVSTRTPRSSDESVYGEANAAYAGLGHGLCASLKSDRGCKDSASAKEQTVVYFNFDNSSFSVGAMSSQHAFQPHRVNYDGSDSKLGWWNLPVFEVPRAKFWAQIHAMIVNVLQPMSRPPNRIVLLGEHGADEDFKEVVQAAMWEQFEFDVEMMLSAVKKEDAGKLAARGAAEMGWLDEQWRRDSEAALRVPSTVEEL